MNQGTNLGSQKGRWIILAALVAVLGALLFLLPGVQAQDGTTINFTENSTDAVVTLEASDPDDATPITWSVVPALENPAQMVGGTALVLADIADFDVFKISQDGVLEFKSPPDYDVAGDVGANNVYNVVVQASDGDAGDNDC